MQPRALFILNADNAMNEFLHRSNFLSSTLMPYFCHLFNISDFVTTHSYLIIIDLITMTSKHFVISLFVQMSSKPGTHRLIKR